MQRNFDTFALPANIHIQDAKDTPEGVEIKWSPDGHESLYSRAFLKFYLENSTRDTNDPEFGTQHWDSGIASDPPTVQFDEVMSESNPAGVARLTRYIATHGFVFVEGTPPEPEPTQKLLERIAFIRVTHYGSFYDFKPDLAMADTAYTNLALPAHTDNTYFSEPSGLQAFHLLSHEPPPGGTASEAPLGGQSLLVDGFHAAKILREENFDAWRVLKTVKLPWHASGNEGITISPDRHYPVLESSSGGLISRIRWNNDDRGVVPFHREHEPAEWYEAARLWQEILKRKTMEYWVQLEPGKPLIFNNWRVLHGRSAFEGIRRMCGGYINRDDFVSRLRNTNLPRQIVLDRVIG